MLDEATLVALMNLVDEVALAALEAEARVGQAEDPTFLKTKEEVETTNSN